MQFTSWRQECARTHGVMLISRRGQKLQACAGFSAARLEKRGAQTTACKQHPRPRIRCAECELHICRGRVVTYLCSLRVPTRRYTSVHYGRHAHSRMRVSRDNRPWKMIPASASPAAARQLLHGAHVQCVNQLRQSTM